jgi:hypothetical protein
VMDLIGHESKAVSQVYTHVGDPEKRRAIRKLPSIEKLLQAADKKGPTEGKPKGRKRRIAGSQGKDKKE